VTDENNSVIENGTSPDELPETSRLLPYHPPAMRHFGGLAELVQRNPGRGTDGGAPADCTHS
jgi:hypothetical protein